MKNFGDPRKGLIRRTVGDEKLRHFGLPALVDLSLFHCHERGLVIGGLQVANQEPVFGQKKRVVAPARLGERGSHLRPDVLVPLGVLVQPVGPHSREEADAFHGWGSPFPCAVSYAIDRFRFLSATPSTSPI